MGQATQNSRRSIFGLHPFPFIMKPPIPLFGGSVLEREPENRNHAPADRSASLSASLELIRRAREGDQEALDALFQRYVPPLRRWAGGRLPRWARDVVDTDDMVQDVLLKTFRNIEKFEPRGTGALYAYLRQAMQRRVLDELRRAQRRPAAQELTPAERDRAASPLEEAIGREALERYEKSLKLLNDQEREAVVCRVEMGMDYGQIAETLGKPSRDAARMSVSRALVRLAKGMGHDR